MNETETPQDYISEMLSNYPDEVKETVERDLKKVRDTVAGTKGQQEAALREQIRLLETNQKTLEQLLNEQKQQKTQTQGSEKDKVLAQRLGIEPDQVPAFRETMKEFGFVTNEELNAITSSQGTKLERKETLQRELNNWEQTFGAEVFKPYKKMIEGIAENNNYDLEPYRDTLVALAQDLQEQSKKHQMNKQDDLAVRRHATTTEPTTGLSYDDKVITHPDGTIDYHATFANLGDE